MDFGAPDEWERPICHKKITPVKVKSYLPHPALREWIINISTVYAPLPSGIAEAASPYPPTPFQSLLFYCKDPVSMRLSSELYFKQQANIILLGPQYSRVNIKVHQQLKAVRVDFYPGAMYRLLPLPMHELLDTGFDAVDFFGAEMREIKEQLGNEEDLEKAKDQVEKFLLKKVDQLKMILPFDEALKIWLGHSENKSIEAVASLACLSLKQFERKCKERLGMTPSTYARIMRFSRAYRMREKYLQSTWTDIAHAAGYFDQMHMIRDFKLFAGVNPSILQQELEATPLRMQRDLPG